MRFVTRNRNVLAVFADAGTPGGELLSPGGVQLCPPVHLDTDLGQSTAVCGGWCGAELLTRGRGPQYDLTKSTSICPTAQPSPTTGRGQVIDGGDGWAVTTSWPEGISGGYAASVKDGVVRWRYPAITMGNHAGYVWPARRARRGARKNACGRT